MTAPVPSGPPVDPRAAILDRCSDGYDASPTSIALVLGAVDAADRAAGYVRIRADDATVAVHIAICEDSIEDCLADRGICVKAVEALVAP